MKLLRSIKNNRGTGQSPACSASRAALVVLILLVTGCAATRVYVPLPLAECGSVPAATITQLTEGTHIGSEENVKATAAAIDALVLENADLYSIVRCYESQTHTGDK